MYPRIIADLDRLRENMERMTALCHAHGLTAALVSKCVCADVRIAGLMAEAGADFLADSRVQNLARLPGSKPRYLLRVAQPSEVDDVVRCAEVSQQSEPCTVRLLGEAAARQGKRHKVVIMIDMGDLREGAIPEGITNLRIGEGYLLGNDTGALVPMEGYHTDCFTLEAQLVEVKRKPSRPIGDCGANAFGEKVEFPDRGEMRRGICAIGRQDVVPGGLTPHDSRVEILGASSDHLIVNLTGAPDYKVGDVLSFNLDYGALLHAYTSEYVTKAYRTAAPFIG